MKSLTIQWQRLVDSEGHTCERCNATYEALQQAMLKLKPSLHLLDIEVILENREISRESFSADPSQSNRIWIAGKPIEHWLRANVASSPCCTVCRGAECRTIELENEVFEAIPSEIILKAALIAAAQLFGPKAQERTGNTRSGCCS